MEKVGALSYRTRVENQQSSSRFTVHRSNANDECRTSANERELAQAQGEQNTSTYRSVAMARFDSQIEIPFPTSASAQLLSFVSSFYSPPPFMPPSFLLTLPHCPSHGPFIPPLSRWQSKRPNAENTWPRVYNPRRSCFQPQQNGPKSARSDLLPNAYNAQTSPREITPVERHE